MISDGDSADVPEQTPYTYNTVGKYGKTNRAAGKYCRERKGMYNG